jgi:hypothetical protein
MSAFDKLLKRGWPLLLVGVVLSCACLSFGAIGAAGLWFFARDSRKPTPTVIAQRDRSTERAELRGQPLQNGWQRVAQGNRVAYMAPAEDNLPFRPALFWQTEPLPQPMNPLQYAAVVYMRLRQQNTQFYAYHAQWVSLNGWPAIELAYAAVQNGQPYEAVVWILTDGYTGYLIVFIAPYGLLDDYAAELPQVLEEATGEVIMTPGPLTGGQAPPVWVGGEDMGGSEMSPGMSPEWDWGGVTAEAPLSGFEDPFAHAGWDDGSYDFSGDLYSDLGGGGGYDPEHDAFNTWMAEEWTQALKGENPDPTWMDDAGNLYWEGPSGTLHDWSPDYDPGYGSWDE